jgi:NAD(P)-dependent dehydrogenase (short-subunit alcohol dehydrogenase family)
MRLAGKVVIVTGAARGIGRACAERFLTDGAKVAIADIDGAELARTATALGKPDRVTAIAADVTRRTDLERLVAATVDAFGRVDIMVNNAGIVRKQDFLDISEEDFDAVVGVNLKGAFFGVQTAARQMIAQGGGGVIINMSSINASSPTPRSRPMRSRRAA